jgi:hypothetical protein
VQHANAFQIGRPLKTDESCELARLVEFQTVLARSLQLPAAVSGLPQMRASRRAGFCAEKWPKSSGDAARGFLAYSRIP